MTRPLPSERPRYISQRPAAWPIHQKNSISFKQVYPHLPAEQVMNAGQLAGCPPLREVKGLNSLGGDDLAQCVHRFRDGDFARAKCSHEIGQIVGLQCAMDDPRQLGGGRGRTDDVVP